MNNGKVSFLSEVRKHTTLRRALALDEPYNYKGVNFYPVSLKDIVEFYLCVDVLMIKQERMKDKKLMKLPYMWFLIYAAENWKQYEKPEFSMYIPMLHALLELVTQSNDIEISIERNDKGGYKKCYLIINGVQFNYKEFLEIRQIIFAQAGIDHSDDFINSDTEQAIYEGLAFSQEKSGYIHPTLEDKIDILAMYLHMSVTELKQLFTIRKFNNAFMYMAKFEDYKLLKFGEYSGGITLKEKLPYWISGHEKADILKGQEDYKKSSLFKV